MPPHQDTLVKSTVVPFDPAALLKPGWSGSDTMTYWNAGVRSTAPPTTLTSWPWWATTARTGLPPRS